MEFLRPIRVLMLESHPPDVQVMKETLELAGLPAQVTSVSSPDEVLFAAMDGTLDIALLNLQLPDVDAALVDELRSLDGAKRLPIIAFSDERPEHADHVFPKPEHEAEYMGIVAAIRFYWMSAAPSLPPPPQSVEAGCETEGLAEEGTIRPQRLSGVDLMGLHIEPVEAYLLSMVDGKMGVDEISLSIGAEVKETRAMLRRLAGLGVVAWRAPHPSLAPPPPPSIAPPPTPSATPIIINAGFRKPMMPTSNSVAKERSAQQSRAKSQAESARAQPKGPAATRQPSAAPPEPVKETKAKTEAPQEKSAPPKTKKPAGGNVFSDDERKKSIDDAYALLGEADYYELLGVPRTAEKKVIRSEYFKLAKLFHTDSLYGVELEEYGPKMDKVFQALTEAYEVLSKNKKRHAYDAYLGVVSETASLEAPRHSTPPARPSLIPKVSVIPEAPAERAPLSRNAKSKPAPSPQPQPAKAVHPPQDSGRSRREIANKLLARRTGRQVMHPLQPESQEQGKAVLEAFTKNDRASRLIKDARQAEKQGNITGAAEALRIASAWRPYDAELAKDAERLRQAALVEKAPAFKKRARYAEKNGNWEDAATCWSRVADVHLDDHAAARSAASAIVEARGDLKQAAVYAKRSAELAPKDATCQRVLGEVWIAAGMPASAKRSLKEALKLDPEDKKAASLLEGL